MVTCCGVAISRLNQPEPRLRNVGGRKRQGAAQRIESLLHAFADGRFGFGFGALPADFAQAGSEHRRRHDRGRAKGEHDHHDGDEDENRKYERLRHD